MQLGLDGKVALVSGGSKGIGRAVAAMLAAERAKVVITARGEDALDSTAAELRERGAEVHTVVADMTQPSEIARAVDLAVDHFGPIDIAIANVYPHHTRTLDDTTDNDFIAEFHTMVMSAVHLTRRVVPSMKERGFGRLINIGSVTMKGPTFGFPMILSNVMRPAVVGLNKSLSHELGAFGITVNNIAVGSIKTERARDSFQKRTNSAAADFDELERARVAELAIPMGRMGEPEDVASLAVFLASPLAGYLTGQTISVDGGRTGGLY
jgi:3-oxoacyl-[acyl-carrier protein] reductase